MSLTKLLSSFLDDKEVVEEVDEDGNRTFSEKDAEGISLKGVLQRARLKIQRAKVPYAQSYHFRPSSITYSYCRRLRVGSMAGLITIFDEVPAPKLQTVFDLGHAIHEILQGYFWEAGILVGSYYCIKCDKIYHDLISPTACPSGIKSHTKKCLSYKEVTLSAEELGYPIRGRTDGILVIEGERHLMDIKSISNRSIGMSDMQFCFEDLADRGPKADHVVQLMLYMWMSGIRRGHLLYVSKNKGEIRSFAIKYDEEVLRPYLEEISSLVEMADKLKKGELVELPAPCGKESCPCDTILGKRPT